MKCATQFVTAYNHVLAEESTYLLIALGGNLGGEDAIARRFRSACEILGDIWGKFCVSSLYRSAPRETLISQDDYVNAAIVFAKIPDDPVEGILQTLHRLESAYGRTRNQVGEPRILDLDLIAVGNAHSEGSICLPHPRWHRRRFVVDPMCELLGRSAKVIGSSKCLGELADELTAQPCVRIGYF